MSFWGRNYCIGSFPLACMGPGPNRHSSWWAGKLEAGPSAGIGITSFTRWEAVRSRKQACSGGKQKRKKPVPNRTGRRAALLRGAKGTKCSHVPWNVHLLGFVANFTSLPGESYAQYGSCPGDLCATQLNAQLREALWTKAQGQNGAEVAWDAATVRVLMNPETREDGLRLKGLL